MNELAQKIYDESLKDPGFMSSGRRNDDAVDFSIACHVLGKDPWEEYSMWATANGIAACEIDKAEEHFDRIAGYLDYWGPEDDVEQALDYLIKDWQ